MSANGTKRTSQDVGPFVRFRATADRHARVASTASVVNDPQLTWAGSKSRSAARPGVILSPPSHDPRGRVAWQSISIGENS
jgi:hypothetical protein